MQTLAKFERYPNNLSMRLDSIALDDTRFELYLTLKLNSQFQPVLDGQVEWGLKGGCLSILADFCTIEPVASKNGSYHCQPLEREVFNRYNWRLSFNNIKVGEGETIENIKLGTIEIEEEFYHLTAQYAVTPADVSVNETKGLWSYDVSPNKQAILERKIVLFLHETQLSPYLSNIGLGSPDADLETIIFPAPKLQPEKVTELREKLALVYDLESDNIEELAAVGGLDLNKDLAGGNFLATSLNNISLAGADIHQANFRGATLTDADLSEADARYSSFKGADLSGALLSNADLSGADFYRAGLALVNLIGANLTDANLVETNISGANFSAARLKGAKFGNNAGLTPETIEDFRSRGAVISDR